MAEILPIRARRDERSSHIGPPDPPAVLSDEAAQIWRDITSEWIVGGDALPILQLGLESWDRYRVAAEILRQEGPTVVNPNSGMQRVHPAHAVMKDNLCAVRQCFRMLHLEPPTEE